MKLTHHHARPELCAVIRLGLSFLGVIAFVVCCGCFTSWLARSSLLPEALYKLPFLKLPPILLFLDTPKSLDHFTQTFII
jgi:hypothetical protein